MNICAIPNCDWKIRKELKLFGHAGLFIVKRPDLAKFPEQRKHRQILANILCSFRNASECDVLKQMLLAERVGICECHFLKEDIIFVSKDGNMSIKTGAIPVLNVPKRTSEMRAWLKLSRQKSKLVQSITYKTVETQTLIDGLFSTSPQENQLNEELVEKDENENGITFPSNDFSVASELICSLKDQMWGFILKLTEFCALMFKALSLVSKCTFAKEFESINIEVEILKKLYHRDQENFNKSLLDPKNESNIEKCSMDDGNEHLLNANDYFNDNKVECKESMQSDVVENTALSAGDKATIIDIPEKGNKKMPRIIIKSKPFSVDLESVQITPEKLLSHPMPNEKNVEFRLKPEPQHVKVSAISASTTFNFPLLQSPIKQPVKFKKPGAGNQTVEVLVEEMPVRRLRRGSITKKLQDIKNKLASECEDYSGFLNNTVDGQNFTERKVMPINNSNSVNERNRNKKSPCELLPKNKTKSSKRRKFVSSYKRPKPPARNPTYFKRFKVDHKKWRTAYKCMFCDELFKQWFLLSQHDKEHHNSTYVKKCWQCGMLVVDSEYKSHMQKHVTPGPMSSAKS